MRVLKLMACAAGVVLSVICIYGFLGCDDDPVSPPPSGPPDYHVYFDYVSDSTRREFIPIYSTRTMEAVDTFDGAFRDFIFTPDGKYMVTKDASHAWLSLIDMVTRDVIATDTGVRTDLLGVSPNGKYILAGKEGTSEVAIYALDGLVRLWVDTLPWPRAEFLSHGDKMVYSVLNSDTFYVVDFVNSPDTCTRLNGGSGFYPITIALDTASERIYMTGTTESGLTQMRMYDANDLEQLKVIRLPDNFSFAKVVFTTDGSYAYLSAPFAESGSPPGVLRYDAENETLEWFIDASRFISPWLAPQDMQLTPDGRILCLLSEPGSGIQPGNLFMFDTQSGDLLRVFYHEGGQGWHIRIYPIQQ